MQQVICISLSQSQTQLSNYVDLPSSLIRLLEANLNQNISEAVELEIEHELRRSITEPKQILSLKNLAENALYGVAGNSLYSLIVSIISTLPK